MVSGFLVCDIDVARNDAAEVTESDLHGCIDAALVVTAHIVAEPDQGNRLSDVTTSHDQIDGEVAAAYGDRPLCE